MGGRDAGRRQIVLVADAPRFGGSERILIEIARAGVGAGHAVTVLARPAWLAERLSEEVPGLSTISLTCADFREASRPDRRARRLAAQSAELFTAIRRVRPEVIQSVNGGHPGSALCLLALPAARLLGVRHRLLTMGAVPRPRPDTPVAARAQAWLDALVWRSVHRVWGGTDMVGRELVRMRAMPPELYVRIPYGVERTADSGRAASLREEWGVRAGELLVGMVAGTSDAQKGHAVLVEALAEAPQGVRGVMVGADPPADALARAAELGLGRRLLSVGRLPDLAAAYHAFDVLCVPSVADESLPLVVLEAFAAGTPVLASRLSGLPEAVEDGVTGRLFRAGDHLALARVLTELSSDSEAIERWGRAAFEAWHARFSVTAMSEAVLALWQSR